MARPGEDELIARYFVPIAGNGSLGLADDAALVAPPSGHELVITADALVAGVHFFPNDPPGSIARKALGVNLSDLAAKGAEPLGFLLTLALPDGWTEEWLAAFCDELGRCARESGCHLLGGDTVRAAGPTVLSITALGTVPSGRMVRRTTARTDDVICVTGTIGDAALGLALASGEVPDWADALDDADRSHLIDRYRHPQPRNSLAVALRSLASAGMDISDGFTGDLAKMLRASGAGGQVDIERVPLSDAVAKAVARRPDLVRTALSGGDDYEILCAVPEEHKAALFEAAQACQVRLTAVGTVTSEAGLVLRWNGQPASLAPGSFAHF